MRILNFAYNLWQISDVYKSTSWVLNDCIMEKPHKHHEVLRPIRELVKGVGEFVVEKVVPSAVIESLYSPQKSLHAISLKL